MTPESTIVALWVAWLASWGVAAFWSNRTEKGGGIAAEIVFRILFWASATLLCAPFSDRSYYGQVQFWHLNDALKWILVALTATGFSFVWWARIHLGRLWSDWLTKKAGHHVVDTGPYRRVRNRHGEGNILRVIWGRCLNLRLLHKSATGGTLP